MISMKVLWYIYPVSLVVLHNALANKAKLILRSLTEYNFISSWCLHEEDWIISFSNRAYIVITVLSCFSDFNRQEMDSWSYPPEFLIKSVWPGAWESALLAVPRWSQCCSSGDHILRTTHVFGKEPESRFFPPFPKRGFAIVVSSLF